MMGRYIIEQAAELCMATNNVPCLIGYTGVGKTDMGSIIARRNNRNVIELNLALHSTEDLIGYPYKADDGKMHWAPPAWFPPGKPFRASSPTEICVGPSKRSWTCNAPASMT